MTKALFPGKFQPPHLGHIQTLMKLYPDYDEIIVGISEDKPQIISPENVKEIFVSVLKYLPKFKVVLIKGTLTKKETLEGLPEFDILVTGNDIVVKWAKEKGLKTAFVPRSKGIGYSGTEIRKICQNMSQD